MTNPLAVEAVDILYRGHFGNGGLELRDDGGDTVSGATMFGHFSRFDNWYEIDSVWEGRFLERCRPGCYARTFKNNRAQMSVAFDHGYDPQIGDKPLGPIDVLREDDEGGYYEVPLLDTDYNRNFVLPALQGRTIDGRMLGSSLGSSFRFRVMKDEWNMDPGKSAHNPDGIPERSITEARVYEFGPVVYPANPEATAQVRGLTDHFMERSLHRLGRSLDPTATSPATSTDTPNPTDSRTHSEAPQTTATALRMAIHAATTGRKG